MLIEITRDGEPASAGQLAPDPGLARRILIVEDNYFVAHQCESALLDAGYEIVGTVVTADDAVRAAMDRRPELVLMDIYLPGKWDGVDAALECVGTAQSMATAFAIARPGSTVGFVGVPHGVELPVDIMFSRNIGLRGGSAPVRTYIPELLHEVLAGRIHPGRVFDFETDLEGIAEAYAAMDERRAIKSLVRVGKV